MIDWYLKQLDADEQRLRMLLRYVQDTILMLNEPRFLGTLQPGWHDWPRVERQIEADLADIAAKREVVAFFEKQLGMNTKHFQSQVLKRLMLPMADREGYLEEWKP